YNDSRAEGTRAAVRAMTDMNNRCPLTSYVLVGFSQGAVIAGDLTSDIGNGRGPVDEDLVLGAALIADGRRQPGIGQDVGLNPPGQGAEITLREVPTLSTLGLTMTGARPGGFGTLNNRTFQICAPGDLICAAPQSAFNITNLPQTLQVLAGGAGAPVHAFYNTPEFWNLDGQTATSWTLNWARNLIENAPRPPHG
ncbi:MAG: cutinase family protein, partial [Mycobacterium sp.]|nr:cutinase family protein [Mycobacterium sp.]